VVDETLRPLLFLCLPPTTTIFKIRTLLRRKVSDIKQQTCTSLSIRGYDEGTRYWCTARTTSDDAAVGHLRLLRCSCWNTRSPGRHPRKHTATTPNSCIIIQCHPFSNTIPMATATATIADENDEKSRCGIVLDLFPLDDNKIHPRIERTRTMRVSRHFLLLLPDKDSVLRQLCHPPPRRRSPLEAAPPNDTSRTTTTTTINIPIIIRPWKQTRIHRVSNKSLPWTIRSLPIAFCTKPATMFPSVA